MEFTYTLIDYRKQREWSYLSASSSREKLYLVLVVSRRRTRQGETSMNTCSRMPPAKHALKQKFEGNCCSKDYTLYIHNTASSVTDGAKHRRCEASCVVMRGCSTMTSMVDARVSASSRSGYFLIDTIPPLFLHINYRFLVKISKFSKFNSWNLQFFSEINRDP